MPDDTHQIHVLIGQYCAAARHKNAAAMLRLYDADARIFDLWDRASIRGLAELTPIVRDWLGGLGTETVQVTFDQVEIRVAGDFAAVTAFVRFQARDQAGMALRQMVNRLTWSLSRRAAGWQIVHQHTSVPIDAKTIAPKFNAGP